MKISPPVGCYVCGGTVTSQEHVPPKCFFPERKYLRPGEDLRKNLISVPSCDAHNSKKSGGDEYIRAVITSHLETNDIGVLVHESKVMPAIKKSLRMTQSIYENLHIRFIAGSEQAIFNVDIVRMFKGLEYMVRGLYYKQHYERWTSQIVLFSPAFLIPSLLDDIHYHQILRDTYQQGQRVLQDQVWRGENQSVFRYKIKVNKPAVELNLIMQFYGGIPIYALSMPLDKDWAELLQLNNQIYNLPS